MTTEADKQIAERVLNDNYWADGGDAKTLARRLLARCEADEAKRKDVDDLVEKTRKVCEALIAAAPSPGEK